MAEKLASYITMDGKNFGPQADYLKCVETILRVLNLESLLRDRERLDWIEKSHHCLDCLVDNNRHQQFCWSVDFHRQEFTKHDTARQAIDAAIAQQKKEEAKPCE